MVENKYEGTQTEKNLQEAFAGESQARNKYTYFASVAKKEGYEQMSALFLNIRIIGCLEEPVTFHIQHVIHEDSFRTGFAVYVYNDFTFIGRRAG